MGVAVKDVGDAGIFTRAVGHLGGQQVFGADFDTSPVSQLPEFFGIQHLLELGRRVPGLAAVGLVGDDGEAFAMRGGQILHGLQGERKGLDGADHNLLAPGQGFRQFSALALALPLDGGDHAGGALEVEDRLLQLGVQHVAVADHQHTVKQLLVLGVVQVGQKVGGPCNGIGLARAGAVLDQVLLPRALRQHRIQQLAGGVQLVVTREDDPGDLLLAVTPGHQIAANDFQPAIPLPDLFPQVVGAVARGVGRVAGGAVVALVEGQELGGRALQLGGHHDRAVAQGEVHQCPTGEVQQGLGKGLAFGPGDAVEPVLIHRRVDVLRKVGLDFHGGHRDAVEEQHQVDHVIMPRAHLPHHAQAVGGIPGLQRRVHGQCGFELGQLQGLAQAKQFDPVPQHLQGAPVVKLLAHPVQQGGLSHRAMALGQGLPRLGLGGLRPSQHVGREDRPGGVVALCIAFGIQPAMGGQMVADVALELDLVVQGHGRRSLRCRCQTLAPGLP